MVAPEGPLMTFVWEPSDMVRFWGGLLSLLEIKAICADLWRCPNGPMPIPHQPVAAGFSRGTTGCLDTAIAAVQRDLDAAVPCTRVERVGDMKNMRAMGFSG